MITNLNSLAEEIRAINISNGWNVFNEQDMDENDYKVPAIIALIHSEITEAFEEFEQGTGYSDPFITELADVQIRLLDFIGGFGSVDFHRNVKGYRQCNEPPVINGMGEALLQLHKTTSHMLEAYRKQGVVEIISYAVELHVLINAVADCLTDDFDSFVEAKLDKNRTRGYKHGGKRV